MIGVEELFEEASEMVNSLEQLYSGGSTVYSEWRSFVEINYGEREKELLE